MIGADDLANRFTYHPPGDDETIQKYVTIRNNAFAFATRIDALAPDSREKSLAITHLEEAVMWANAAIARERKTE